jgi:branched-chain amino acid aminotransferase
MNKYCYINGEIRKEDREAISIINEQRGVYEVIRVIDETPLFAKEHIDRLFKSAKLANINISMTEEVIFSNICRLSKKNSIAEQNIKLIFTANDQLFYFIESFYPPSEMVQKGIKTVFYEVVRDNPNAKIHNAQLRNDINNYLKRHGAYEAVLVDENGIIAEGSRSNMFFVKNEKLYTAPSDKVLMGITREKVLEICRENDIQVIEENVHIKDLPTCQGAFMTSTSNNVLPIRQIEEFEFKKIDRTILLLLSKFEEVAARDLLRMKDICGEANNC